MNLCCMSFSSPAISRRTVLRGLASSETTTLKLMALGIANSLPEAVQSATTELARWLQRDYKLDPNEAAIVLGTSMQYNIAELVDPLVHVVAKIRKDAVALLR